MSRQRDLFCRICLHHLIGQESGLFTRNSAKKMCLNFGTSYYFRLSSFELHYLHLSCTSCCVLCCEAVFNISVQTAAS